MLKNLLVLGLLLSLSACGSPEFSDFYTPEESAAMKLCEVDSDCVEVNLHCGNCYCYGSAYNEAYASELRDVADQLCVGWRDDEPECMLDCPHEVPRCIEGSCTMASPSL